MPRKNRTEIAAPATPPTIDRQPRTLTDFQELVCNLCADLILNGGDQIDVSRLVAAAMGHSFNLRFPECGWREDRIKRDSPEWLKMLSRHWPAKVERKHPLPTTVSEMVRANLRGNLEEKFTEFLAAARMQELYLMFEVLESFDGLTAGPDDDHAESVLAEAFMRELSSDDTYVRVPRDRVEAVEQFLEEMDEPPADVAPAGHPKLLVFPARQEVSHAS